MIRKPPELELPLLKNALHFLAEEWLQLADTHRLEGSTQTDFLERNVELARADTYVEAANAITLLIFRVEMQILDDNIAPLSIARNVVKTTSQDNSY